MDPRETAPQPQPASGDDKSRVKTEDEKAKGLAEQAEGEAKDELADRTGRRR